MRATSLPIPPDLPAVTVDARTTTRIVVDLGDGMPHSGSVEQVLEAAGTSRRDTTRFTRLP